MHCTFRKAINVCIFLKGIWKPQRIPNPDFFEDKEPYRMTTVVGSKYKTNLHIEGGIRNSRVCFLQGGQISKTIRIVRDRFPEALDSRIFTFLISFEYTLYCRPLVSTDVLLAGCGSVYTSLYCRLPLVLNCGL